MDRPDLSDDNTSLKKWEDTGLWNPDWYPAVGANCYAPALYIPSSGNKIATRAEALEIGGASVNMDPEDRCIKPSIEPGQQVTEVQYAGCKLTTTYAATKCVKKVHLLPDPSRGVGYIPVTFTTNPKFIIGGDNWVETNASVDIYINNTYINTSSNTGVIYAKPSSAIPFEYRNARKFGGTVVLSDSSGVSVQAATTYPILIPHYTVWKKVNGTWSQCKWVNADASGSSWAGKDYTVTDSIQLKSENKPVHYCSYITRNLVSDANGQELYSNKCGHGVVEMPSKLQGEDLEEVMVYIYFTSPGTTTIDPDSYNYYKIHYSTSDGKAISLAGKTCPFNNCRYVTTTYSSSDLGWWYFAVDKDKTITEVVMWGFYGLQTLTDVALYPQKADGNLLTTVSTITKIGPSAFAHCVKFTGTVLNSKTPFVKGATGQLLGLIPDSVTTLGAWCFKDTAIEQINLEKVTLFDEENSVKVTNSDGSVTTTFIGDKGGPFCQCSKLQLVKLSPNLTYLPARSFDRCSALMHVTYNETPTVTANKQIFNLPCTKIGAYCFSDVLQYSIKSKTNVWSCDIKLVKGFNLGDSPLTKIFTLNSNNILKRNKSYCPNVIYAGTLAEWVKVFPKQTAYTNIPEYNNDLDGIRSSGNEYTTQIDYDAYIGGNTNKNWLACQYNLYTSDFTSGKVNVQLNNSNGTYAYVFYNCANLGTVIIMDTNFTQIGSSAFAYAVMDKILVGAGVTLKRFRDYAFYQTKIGNIDEFVKSWLPTECIEKYGLHCMGISGNQTLIFPPILWSNAVLLTCKQGEGYPGCKLVIRGGKQILGCCYPLIVRGYGGSQKTSNTYNYVQFASNVSGTTLDVIYPGVGEDGYETSWGAVYDDITLLEGLQDQFYEKNWGYGNPAFGGRLGIHFIGNRYTIAEWKKQTHVTDECVWGTLTTPMAGVTGNDDLRVRFPYYLQQHYEGMMNTWGYKGDTDKDELVEY